MGKRASIVFLLVVFCIIISDNNINNINNDNDNR